MARSPETGKRMKIGRLGGKADAIRHDAREVRIFNERRGGVSGEVEAVLRGWEEEAEALYREADVLEAPDSPASMSAARCKREQK